MSGGIDSLVAAHLLKEQGTDITGIHFTTGFEPQPMDLSGIEDKLDLKIHKVDLTCEFNRQVVDYFVDTYARGKTPNPCVRCNQTIKFGILAEKAKALGSQKIATGHYARIRVNKNGEPALLKGVDAAKEQSYFLSMLSQKQLETAIFPLGGLTKECVREIARTNNLVPMEKKESQDICFVKNASFANFVAARFCVKPCPGNIVLFNDNRIIGQHRGLHGYTIGQRRGLNCPGPEPYYVKTIDVKTNTLVVCGKKDLYTTKVILDHINWITPPFTSREKVITKIRYSHKGANSELRVEDNQTTLVFDEPQLAVTPGQVAVFYRDDQVLGAGTIQ